MELRFWKHKEKPEVIKQECYNKLPPAHQGNYEPTEEEATHEVDDDSDDFATTLIEAAAIEDIASEIDNSDNSGSSDAGGSVEMGGGDFGGGGASGDY